MCLGKHHYLHSQTHKNWSWRSFPVSESFNSYGNGVARKTRDFCTQSQSPEWPLFLLFMKTNLNEKKEERKKHKFTQKDRVKNYLESVSSLPQHSRNNQLDVTEASIYFHDIGNFLSPKQKYLETRHYSNYMIHTSWFSNITSSQFPIHSVSFILQRKINAIVFSGNN